jgi:hypothetical protein
MFKIFQRYHWFNVKKFEYVYGLQGTRPCLREERMTIGPTYYIWSLFCGLLSPFSGLGFLVSVLWHQFSGLCFCSLVPGLCSLVNGHYTLVSGL